MFTTVKSVFSVVNMSMLLLFLYVHNSQSSSVMYRHAGCQIWIDECVDVAAAVACCRCGYGDNHKETAAGVIYECSHASLAMEMTG